MNNILLQSGLNDVSFHLLFTCSPKVTIQLDLTKWKNFNKTLQYQGPLENSGICLHHFGIHIPLTRFCIILQKVFITSQGITGSIEADISLLKLYSFKKLPLYQFSVGSTNSKCLNMDEMSCVKDASCGWCKAKSKCLEARKDGLSDVCQMCDRCEFYNKNNLYKEQCLQKRSCGWCDSDKICYPGDELGTFQKASACYGNPKLWNFKVFTQVNETPEKKAEKPLIVAKEDPNEKKKSLFTGLIEMSKEMTTSKPFTFSNEIQKDSLGMKLKFEPLQSLKVFGIRPITFNFQFHSCSHQMGLSIDLSEYNMKPVTKNLLIETPNICLPTIGVQFFNICLSFDNIIISKSYISSTVYGNLQFLSFSFYKLPLKTFSLGEVDHCTTLKSKHTCLLNNGCGWCKDKNICLSSRPDKKGDVCLFCKRCSFFSSKNERDECLRKSSCGWCNYSQQCLEGDEVGPFNEICSLDKSSQGEILGDSNEWVIQDHNSNSYTSFLYSMISIIVNLIAIVIISLLIMALVKMRDSYDPYNP